MKLERINLWQFGLLIFISRSVLSLSEMPVLTTGQAGRDGWIASLVNVLIGIPIVLFYTGLAKRFPKQTIFDYSEMLLGPILGRIATLPLLWGFLHYASVILRAYGEVIVTAVLPETPLVFVMGAMIFVCAVAVRMGLEVLGRAAEILVPLFVLAAAGVCIFALTYADFTRLMPSGIHGISPIIRAAIIPSGFYFLYATIFVVYPSLKDKHRVTGTALLASITAGLLVTAGVVVALGVFGPNDVSRHTFPFLNLARIIRIAEFVERIETVALAAWGVGLFLDLAFVYYAGARGLALWLNVKNHRRLVFPMGAILLTLSLTLFPTAFEMQNFLKAEVVGPYGTIMIFGTPAIIWLASLLPKNKKYVSSQDEGEPM